MKSLLTLALVLASSLVTANAMASSLCGPNEKPLFECSTGARSYALCASKDLGPKSGTLQYRASKSGTIEMMFPQDLNGSASKFQGQMMNRGVQVIFENGGYVYNLATDIDDNDNIWVQKNDKTLSNISCHDKNSEQSDLAMTSTINLLTSAGVMPQN